ncbi:hypothetical protein Tco_0524158 [Tanacetum coccineum]
MEAHLAPKKPIQVNKITSSCEIGSGPHDSTAWKIPSKILSIMHPRVSTKQEACVTKVKKEEEPNDTPQKGSDGPTIINELESDVIKEEKELEWLDIEEPLDLVDACEESVYESLIKEIPWCSLNFDFRIEKGNPNNLKFPCMIRHKFISNAYIDIDSPMNVMSFACYNDIRRNNFKHRGKFLWELEKIYTYL